jgi:septal ring factor EnvC (AmiA/AmiB activator)
LPHYIEAADIADRKLQASRSDRRDGVATRRKTRSAIDPPRAFHTSNARCGYSSAAKRRRPILGQTQFRLAQFLAEIPSERDRARATAEAARASFVAVHASAQSRRGRRLSARTPRDQKVAIAATWAASSSEVG